MASIIFLYSADMTKSFRLRALHRSRLLKPGLIILLLGSVWIWGCDYDDVEDRKRQGQTLFPELAPGTYFGEIELAGKRQGVVDRLPLLVVVQQAGRLSWSVGDYTVRDVESSYAGVANIHLPFTLELKDGVVELAWDKPKCSTREQCLLNVQSMSRWQGDAIWRGSSRKKKSIAVVKDTNGRVGGWFLRPLTDEPDLPQSGQSGDKSVEQTAGASAPTPVSEQSAHPSVVPVLSPTAEIPPAVQRFDLSGTLFESGFCSLSDEELTNLTGKFQSEREELAKQLYYTAKATPAGRLVWLSRLLLSQESTKIRPVAEVAAAPVIDNEIEAEKKRLAALQALGIE